MGRSVWKYLPRIDAPEAAPQPTYFDELDHISSRLMMPCGILALVAWLPFLEVDLRVFGSSSPVLGLRLGMSVVGVALLALQRVKHRAAAYWAVFGFLCYMQLAASAIVGWSAGEPAYLGGLAICFFLLTFWPLEPLHAYGLLGASVLAFSAASVQSGTGLSSPLTRYGLYDLVITVLIAALGISWFGRWRVNLYEHRRELQRVNEELYRANRLKTEFLGVACHDLKNPLNVIVGSADLIEMKLKRDGALTPDVASNLERILDASGKMLLLTRRFLQGAESRDGELRLQPEDLDLSELVRSVVEANRFLGEHKGQELHAEVQPGCRTVGDRVCLQAIIDNLVNNAIKYSPRDGAIRVSLGRREGVIRLEVRDDGPGFSAADAEQLFGRGQRLSARPTGGESSEGLGLAIVKRMVDAHGGRVWLESEPGLGARFFVELKASPPSS